MQCLKHLESLSPRQIKNLNGSPENLLLSVCVKVSSKLGGTDEEKVKEAAGSGKTAQNVSC